MVHHKMNFSFVLKSVIDTLFWPPFGPFLNARAQIFSFLSDIFVISDKVGNIAVNISLVLKSVNESQF